MKIKKINPDEIVERVAKKIGIRFRNKEILIESLTHPSFKHENPEFNSDNQRLEFLGDAVLNMVITELLFEKYKEASEGILTQKRIFLVKEETLFKKAKELGLEEFILLGTGEEKQGGRNKSSILGDLFEAFIGALYLDKGYEYTKDFLSKLFKEEIEDVNLEIDWKNLLQSYLYREGKKPRYILVKEEGPEHNKVFYVELWVEEKKISEGKGKNKKEAETNAAKKAVERLKDGLS